LINDSKFGYDARGNVLRLTLLRSPTWPDPNADRGMQHFSYALYPHGGDWRQALTVRHGFDFNYQLSAMQLASHTGEMPAEQTFVSVEPENVVLTAMKKAKDSDALVFHLYEWAGKSGNITLTLPPGATGATETNLLEQPVGDALPVTGDQVTVPVHPYEIVAVRVDYSQNR
jgi:alpha-mannosidase